MALDQLPAVSGALRVLLPALGVPGETLADLVPLQQRRFEERLGGAAVALDELDHRALEAVAERTQQHSQGGAGLSLAVARVNDDQSLSAAGRSPLGDSLLSQRLHLPFMLGRVSHGGAPGRG